MCACVTQDQREWIAGLWWMSGPFEGKLPADGGFVLGAIAASFDLEAKQRDPDLELFCMVSRGLLVLLPYLDLATIQLAQW